MVAIFRIVLLFLVLFTGAVCVADAQCIAPSKDLNNRYRGDDGATYYVSQYGSDVWWVGLSNNDGKRFTNVFHGTLSGNVITGAWADVPLGSTHNHGDLKLIVENTNATLRKMYMTGGFTGSTWSLYAPCGDTQLNSSRR